MRTTGTGVHRNFAGAEGEPDATSIEGTYEELWYGFVFPSLISFLLI